MKTAALLLLLALPAVAQTPVKHSVTLTWTASISANTSAYKVWRATVSGGPYILLGTTSGTSFVNGSNPDGTPLQEGQTFYYKVQSVAGPFLGEYSTEVSATIPSVPAPPTNLKAVAR